jgi:hypothetical protein
MQQKSKLYLASVKDLEDPNKQDVSLWHSFYDRVVSHNVPLVDRSEKIIMPYDFKLYEPFKIPQDLSNFNLTYEECCNKRAVELVELSKKLSKPIMVFYSGGIDSTIVLISFIKSIPQEEIRDRIIVAMTPDSIVENPNFYYEHVLPRFKLCSSEQFGNLFTNDHIIVGGEHNDQLFGSDIVGKIDTRLGFHRVLEPYKQGLLKEWFVVNDMSEKQADWWFDMLVWHAENSPCEIKTSFDLLWWLNFNFKWQSVFFRMLLRVSTNLRTNINQSYVNDNFKHFYSSDDFQKWSMTNQHIKIKTSWDSYKYHARDLIFNFTKDHTYHREKLKRGSLFKLFLSKDTPVGLTSEYDYLYKIQRDEFYNPINSFDITRKFQ